jgi:hypothetical protein
MVKLADASRGDDVSLQWLRDQDLEVFIRIAKKTAEVIKRKEFELKDYHRFHI